MDQNRRIELHEILCNILGNMNVYFQPPESINMDYPAIVYSREDIKNTFADDEVYLQSRFYLITVIDRDPDSEIVDKISKLPKCKHDRHFKSGNLNHDTFLLQY